ncbi:MAG: hypothetical protein KAH25_06315 [Bacteroidales bacterium]|nr:hypothetical protein [Bacteroidales bacterium]
MKKLLLILFLIPSVLSWSQTKSELFNSTEINFYGLDFTFAKYVAHKKLPDPLEIVERYYREWNNMYLDEYDGYDMTRPFKKDFVYYDTLVYGRNAMVSSVDLLVEKPESLDMKAIRSYIETYADKSKTGFGAVYIIESLNASDKYLSAWLTFFDVKTGDLVFSEPIRVRANGRNFHLLWHTAFDELYIETKDNYRIWRKMYK